MVTIKAEVVSGTSLSGLGTCTGTHGMPSAPYTNWM